MLTIPQKRSATQRVIRANGLELPDKLPEFPSDIASRFPTLENFQRQQSDWWFQTRQALQARDEEISVPLNKQTQSAQATLDSLNAQITALTQQIAALQGNVADFQLKSQRGVANGYASLNASARVPASQLPFAIETATIPSGVDQVSVSGMGWPSVPRINGPVIIKPAGALTLFASLVDGTVTADGCVFDLSGVTDLATYILAFGRFLL